MLDVFKLGTAVVEICKFSINVDNKSMLTVLQTNHQQSHLTRTFGILYNILNNN